MLPKRKRIRPRMLVKDIKERLNNLGMEYEERWIPAHDPRWKEVEVYKTDEQIEQDQEESATSWVFTGGWVDAEELLMDIGIL